MYQKLIIITTNIPRQRNVRVLDPWCIGTEVSCWCIKGLPHVLLEVFTVRCIPPAPTFSPLHHVPPFIKSWNNMARIYYLIREPGIICTTEATILNLALISFDLCGTSSVRSVCSSSLVPLQSPLFTVTVIWTMMKHGSKSTQQAFLWMSI